MTGIRRTRYHAGLAGAHGQLPIEAPDRTVSPSRQASAVATRAGGRARAKARSVLGRRTEGD